MKAALLSLAFCCSAITLPGQVPLSTDEALKQLYHQYDPVTKTAQWVCTKEQQSQGPHAGWECVKEDTTVSVSVILAAQVSDGDEIRTYLATSAKPAKYGCHGCAPAVGAAVFVWQDQGWALESANAAIGFFGGWGEHPSVDLIAIGPQKYGLLLSFSDMAQGFVSSFKDLLAPVGGIVREVWSIEDEDDDLGAIDLNDKANSPAPYRSSAAFRFLAGDETVNGWSDHGASDYYDIEVISRGSSRQDYDHPVKQQNWTAIYTFKDGKYKLLRRTVFTEVKSPAKPARR